MRVVSGPDSSRGGCGSTARWPVEAGTVAGEHHLQVRLFGERARRVGKRALEDLGGAFAVDHGQGLSAKPRGSETLLTRGRDLSGASG